LSFDVDGGRSEGHEKYPDFFLTTKLESYFFLVPVLELLGSREVNVRAEFPSEGTRDLYGVTISPDMAAF